MKKLKAFFYIFKKSLTSPEYYKELLETRFNYSIKYFVMLAIFASLIVTVAVSIRTFPGAKAGIKAFAEQVKQMYPEDLVLTVKSGQWSINKPEPYVIPLPKVSEDKKIENVVVFYKKGTIDDLDSLKTYALVNENNVVVRDSNEGIRAYPIKNFPDFEVNKSTISSMVDSAYGYLKNLPYFLPLIIFLGQLVFNYFGVKVIYLLWVGLVIYLYSLIRKNKISYKNACRVGIHTMTLPLIIEVVLGVANIEIPLSGWFFLVNIILAIFMLIRSNRPDLPTIDTQNPQN